MAFMKLGLPGAPPTYAVCFTGIEEVAAVATIASTVVGVMGTMAAAKSQQQQLNYEAAIARQQGQERMAAASYEGVQEKRRATLAMERTQALAAASGGGATDPTVLKDEGDIAGQGEYNKLMRVATGGIAKNSYNEQSQLDAFQSAQVGEAAKWSEAGTILKGTSSFFSQYGADIFPGGGVSAGGGASPYGGMSGPDSIAAQLGH